MLKKFMEQHELKNPSFVTPRDSTMQDDFGVTGIPHVVLIDREGIIRLIKVGAGPTVAKDIHAKIKELIKE